jgi:outer membrane protein OmpA-like peptidoglycan-associated protein
MLDDQDEGARIGVWVALGVVAMLLFGLIFGLAIRATKDKVPAATAVATAAAPAAGDDAVLDLPLSGDIVGKVYFEIGKAEVPADAAKALDDGLAAVNADGAKKLMLSGFHDASGDPAKNAELAKERAKAVRAALVAKGVAADRIVLRKPEQTAADGPADEARRVEIRLVTLP